MGTSTKSRLAIFASGEGTTLSAVADACFRGLLNAEVALVISNNRDSGALRRAGDAGLKFLHLSSLTHPDPSNLDCAMVNALTAAATDYIVLAGYMRKIGPRVLKSFEGKILNSHPALLPKFGGRGMYGRRVHEAVLASGERVTGVTVHLVTAGYDEGPVIAQTEVQVQEHETVESLAERVQAREREFIVETLRALVGV